MADRIPSTLDRRTFLGAALATGATALVGAEVKAPATRLDLETATVDSLQAGLVAGRWTAVDLVKQHQARIRALDRSGLRLGAVLELNRRPWPSPRPWTQSAGRARCVAPFTASTCC